MTDISQAKARMFSELVRRAMVVLRNLRRTRVLMRTGSGVSSMSEIDELNRLWDEINSVVDSLGPDEDEQVERMAR